MRKGIYLGKSGKQTKGKEIQHDGLDPKSQPLAATRGSNDVMEGVMRQVLYPSRPNIHTALWLAESPEPVLYHIAGGWCLVLTACRRQRQRREGVEARSARDTGARHGTWQDRTVQTDLNGVAQAVGGCWHHLIPNGHHVRDRLGSTAWRARKETGREMRIDPNESVCSIVAVSRVVTLRASASRLPPTGFPFHPTNPFSQ